jgi:heme exporter protein D
MNLPMLHLGGRHAAYVWAAYGITAPVLAGLVIQSLLQARYWRRKAEGQEIETSPDRARP